MSKRSNRPFFAILLAALYAYGCGGGSSSPAPPPPPLAAATHFSLTVPATATAGTRFQVMVTALSATNATATTYSGTVHFSSSDDRAVLPADATLSSGTGSLAVTLFSTAAQTIMVTDRASSSITGISGAITVNAAQFSPSANMSVGRQFHTATLLNDGTVLITGGTDGTNSLATSELFDAVTATFAATGSLATARQQATATLLGDGKVLVAGGFDANGQVLASAELYDPSTKTFSPASSMATARGEHTATLLKNGKVLFAGGVAGGTAELFDPNTGTFSTTSSMATMRFRHAAVLLNSGVVLVAGGYDNQNISATAELYDPASGTFIAAGPMTAPRAFFTATLLADGKVLLAGGDNVEQPIGASGRSTGELFDPAVGTFSSAGQMSMPRERHTATLLGDGTVLIAGGDFIVFTGGATRVGAFPHTTATTELFDPGSVAFTAGQNLQQGRTNHTATLLTSGKVLITGGMQTRFPIPQAPPKVSILSGTELLE